MLTGKYQAYREAIIVLKEELREKDKLIRELTEKIMSRDFNDYNSAKQPAKDTSEIIKPEDDPYLDPESVPELVTSEELDEALKNAQRPR